MYRTRLILIDVLQNLLEKTMYNNNYFEPYTREEKYYYHCRSALWFLYTPDTIILSCSCH